MQVDCLIVGGGPAGSALAATLARWGKSVALVHLRAGRRLIPEETLVAGAEERFERAGLGGVLEAIEHGGSPRQGSVWSADTVGWRTMQSDAERGLKIDRDAFDSGLRARASERGVRVFEGKIDTAEAGDRRQLVVVSEDGAQRIEPRVVVGATGRATLDWIPCEETSRAPQLVALSAHVVDPVDRDATVIEAVAEGWLWWLPLHSGGVHVTLFVDGEVLRERGADDLWASALQRARGPARGACVEGSRGVEATPYLRRSTGDSLLVGDAACRIDPLSSQGVEKALASAEDCAYSVNTLLEYPELADHVRRHRFHWERRLFEAHERQTLAFYRREERFVDQPFWRRRHAAFDELARPSGAGLPAALALHPALEEATVLRRRDRCFEETAGYRLPDGGEELERVGGLRIAPIVELVGGGVSARDLLRRAPEHPELFTLSDAALVQGLTELVRLGVLVDAAT